MERIVEFANRLFGLPDELEKLSGKSIDWIKFSILTFLRKIKINKYSLKPFDKYKCIFIHIPRTGGVSLTKSLFNLSSVGHFDIQTYQKTFSEIEFNSYFKFTFVRNPWDRLVSGTNFLKQEVCIKLIKCGLI